MTHIHWAAGVTAETVSGVRQPLLPDTFFTQMHELYNPAKGNQQAADRPFAVKHFNIMDPLLRNNNLGRSVSKASFYRLRKALRHGALTLTQAAEQVRMGADPCTHAL